MKKAALFLWFVLSSMHLLARTSFTIKGGANFSNLMENGTGIQMGVTFGVGQEWRIFRNTSLALELFLSTRGGMLRNKSVRPSGMIGYEYVNYYDIRCRFGSIDLPILLKQWFPLTRSSHLGVFIGPCMSLGVSDKSRLNLLRSESLWDPEKQEYRKFDYDYASCFDCFSWFEGSGFTVMAGLEMVWDFFSFECRIPLKPYSVDRIGDVYVYENIQVVHFLFGIHF